MSNLVGKTIDRYHILEQLGEGGMAIVYKAYDTRLERDVAIKIIRTDVFGSSILDRILKRFEREAKSLAKLSHPNIVKVHDYGDYEGSPYLVLEYLPAGTVKERLGKPIPWQEAVRILIPIAEALEYAHEHNIVHRDIKPSNILLTEKGQPMLTDFGIAKILENEDAATLTGTGLGVGTPEYMSPEQWTGSATAQSDIYSLGVVLYEMVTGRKPYTADTPAAILLKQATEPLSRPNSYVSDLPDSIEKVLLKALARNPKDRYQDAGALVEGLENLLIRTSKSREFAAIPKVSKPVESDLATQDTYLQDETYGTSLETKTYDESPRKSRPAQLEVLEHDKDAVPIPGWRSVLWIALGWAVGIIIAILVVFQIADATRLSDNILIPLFGAIGGTIGGFTIAFTLINEKILASWKKATWIILGWAMAVPIFYGSGSVLLLDNFNFIVLISLAITTLLISGFLTAIPMYTEKALSSWKDIVWIVFGWIIAVAIGIAGGVGIEYIKEVNGIYAESYVLDAAIVFAIGGAIMGTIGGSIMVWRLRIKNRAGINDLDSHNFLSSARQPQNIIWWPWGVLVIVIVIGIVYTINSQEVARKMSETATAQVYEAPAIIESPAATEALAATEAPLAATEIPVGPQPIKAANAKDIIIWGSIGFTNFIESMSFSRDSSMLAVSGSDGVWLYDVIQDKEISFPTINADSVHTVSFNSTGTILFSGSADPEGGQMRAWDWKNRKELWSIVVAPKGWGVYVSNSLDNKWLATSVAYDGVILWNMGSPPKKYKTISYSGGGPSSFSPKGNWIGFWEEEGSVHLYNITTGEEKFLKASGSSGYFPKVSFSPNGDLVAAGDWDGVVHIWRVKDGSVVKTINAHEDWVRSIAFSPSGEVLVTGGNDNLLKLWRVSDGTLLKTLEDHLSCINSIAFSSDGRLLVSGSEDGNLIIWAVVK